MKKLLVILLFSFASYSYASEMSEFEKGYREGLSVSSGRVLMAEGTSGESHNHGSARYNLKLLCENGVVKQVICSSGHSEERSNHIQYNCAGLCVND